MNALSGMVACLKRGTGEIHVEPVRGQALRCIERILDFVVRNPQAITKPQQGPWRGWAV